MTDTQSAATPCALPAEMTIPHAAQVREMLLQATSIGQNHFDAHEVESIDSSGIQLLLALQRSLQSNGVTLSLDSPSQALLDALRLYGLGGLVQTEQ